ncbi:hypothetical protein BDQ17DRAFT_1372527 [Cyathus striatus]|nr:hypothetical protein BDQ17DRAFT_1372527 [Cyathus striatus]
MARLNRIILVLSLNVVTYAATVPLSPIPPGLKGLPSTILNELNLTGTGTKTTTIVNTAMIVDQRSGAGSTMPPNLPVPDTVVTAIDGTLMSSTTSSSRRSLDVTPGNFSPRPQTVDLSKRILAGYEQLFAGTGTMPSDRDASIEGTAYLTYTLVPNSTYNIDACLQFCNTVDGCVFANLYYEFNNALLDFVFSEKSNLKCAVYADVHNATEKTNFGGQQLEPPPAGLTFIQQSSGFAATSLVDPPTPEGYELVFGPIGGANNAPGYMGFVFLDRYDVEACAQQCNTRGADPMGGACQFFNIWRAVVNGLPTTYTCSMYFIPADASTAVNTGQGDLVVTFSRGYQRKNILPDGGFESFKACTDFCQAASDANWIGTSPANGSLDATVFFFAPFAHSGNSSGLLGSAFGVDPLPGTLAAAKALQTVPGKQYQISFFESSSFSGPVMEANAFFQVLWNNQVVLASKVGFTNWELFSVTVTAKGNDLLAFHGGSAPAWTFLDDITVFET